MDTERIHRGRTYGEAVDDAPTRGGKLVLSWLAIAVFGSALDLSASRLEDGEQDENLATRLESLATDLDSGSGGGVPRKRQDALAETLDAIAARLR